MGSPLLRGGSVIPVVQAAHDGHGDQFPFAFENCQGGRLATQSLMRPTGVVVLLQVLPQEPFEMSLTQHDHMVQQLSP